MVGLSFAELAVRDCGQAGRQAGEAGRPPGCQGLQAGQGVLTLDPWWGGCVPAAGVNQESL